MSKRLLPFLLFFAAVPTVVSAQSVEIVFTPAALQQALAVKSSLKADKVESFGALGLVGASAAQKKAYADKVAGVTALVIVGEDALKATVDIDFTCSIIVVNAVGGSPGGKRIIRVFESKTAPPNAKPLSPTAVAEAIASNGAVKGDIGEAVQAILGSLK